MFCKYCNKSFDKSFKKDSIVCPFCKKQLNIMDSILQWLPLLGAGVAFLIFGFFGGDPELGEINKFDYAAAAISFGAFVGTFNLISRKRKLFIVSIIITTMMSVLIVGAVL